MMAFVAAETDRDMGAVKQSANVFSLYNSLVLVYAPSTPIELALMLVLPVIYLLH